MFYIILTRLLLNVVSNAYIPIRGKLKQARNIRNHLEQDGATWKKMKLSRTIWN